MVVAAIMLGAGSILTSLGLLISILCFQFTPPDPRALAIAVPSP